MPCQKSLAQNLRMCFEALNLLVSQVCCLPKPGRAIACREFHPALKTRAQLAITIVFRSIDASDWQRGELDQVPSGLQAYLAPQNLEMHARMSPEEQILPARKSVGQTFVQRTPQF